MAAYHMAVDGSSTLCGCSVKIVIFLLVGRNRAQETYQTSCTQKTFVHRNLVQGSVSLGFQIDEVMKFEIKTHLKTPSVLHPPIPMLPHGQWRHR